MDAYPPTYPGDQPTMPCGTCFDTHTTFETALTCYRKTHPYKDSGSPETASGSPSAPPTSTTIFRHGRAFTPGRPSVNAAVQRQKARDRNRAYRERQRSGA